MQKARCHSSEEPLQPLVSAWFQGLFHSLAQGSFHLSFTVLVHYRSTGSIQAQRMVPLDSDKVSPASPYSGYSQVYNACRLRDFHPLWLTVPSHSAIHYTSISKSYNPNEHAHWFGLFRFRSPLLTESLLFSLPPPTQMFQFRGFTTFVYTSSMYKVSLFGHLRINSCLHLPVNFRSLPRPSSSPVAKASPMRPYFASVSSRRFSSNALA